MRIKALLVVLWLGSESTMFFQVRLAMASCSMFSNMCRG